jgi:hypothetical protein
MLDTCNFLCFLDVAVVKDGRWDYGGLGWRSNYLWMLKRNRLGLV